MNWLLPRIQAKFQWREYRNTLFKEENVILNLDSGYSQFHYDVLATKQKKVIKRVNNYQRVLVTMLTL